MKQSRQNSGSFDLNYLACVLYFSWQEPEMTLAKTERYSQTERHMTWRAYVVLVNRPDHDETFGPGDAGQGKAVDASHGREVNFLQQSVLVSAVEEENIVEQRNGLERVKQKITRHLFVDSYPFPLKVRPERALVLEEGSIIWSMYEWFMKHGGLRIRVSAKTLRQIVRAGVLSADARSNKFQASLSCCIVVLMAKTVSVR